MIRVTTPSRLHFGLMSLAEEGTHWPDRQGDRVLPARRFGSVGLMIEKPGIQLTAIPATQWSAKGPWADRALAFARRFAENVEVVPHQIFVEHSPPEHVGLGVGTQLALAVGKALAASCQAPLSAIELARILGRGQRSGIGVHGFTAGGFLVDGGKGRSEVPAPLLFREPFPEEWRIVLVLPPHPAGLHGVREQEAFQRLHWPAEPLARTNALCRLVLLGMLPALRESDLPAFGEALFDFNGLVGELFSLQQGGIYGNSLTMEVVEFIHSQGVSGVGQSSWGPVVFAVVENEERGSQLALVVREQFGLSEERVCVTKGRNAGAEVSTEAAGVR